MFKINKETLQKTLDYLARQPFLEVAQIIQDLQAVEEIKEDKKDVTKK